MALPKLTFNQAHGHRFEFSRILRKDDGRPVVAASGVPIRRVIRTDSAAKVAAFDRTNCFTQK